MTRTARVRPGEGVECAPVTPQSLGATTSGGQPALQAVQPPERRPETQTERHDRRKAWGAKWSQLNREVIRQGMEATG